MVLTDFLTSVADAIRQKDGTAEPILAKDMPQRILGISGDFSLPVCIETGEFSFEEDIDTTINIKLSGNPAQFVCVADEIVDESGYIANSMMGVAYLPRAEALIIGYQKKLSYGVYQEGRKFEIKNNIVTLMPPASAFKFRAGYTYRWLAWIKIGQYIAKYADGKFICLTDSVEAAFDLIAIAGKSVQTEIPSPGNPVQIMSIGDKGSIKITVGDGTQSQEITVDTPNGLPGIQVESDGYYTDDEGKEWLCDYVDFQKGVYVKRIANLLFNGDEVWKSEKSSIGVRYLNNSFGADIMLSDTNTNGKNSINSNFPLGASGSTNTKKNVYTIASRTNLPCIFISMNGTETLEEFKQYLQEHPMRVLAILKTPEEIPLTEAELQAYASLHTYEPETTIENDEDAWMVVGYKGKE